AGQSDFSLDDGAANSDLGVNPETDSLFANLRHRFGHGVEAYADVVYMRSRGETHARSGGTSASMSPDNPANPFNDYISLTFPIGGIDAEMVKRTTSARYTGGLLLDLPLGWRGNVEITSGAFHFDQGSRTIEPFFTLLLTGDPNDPNPFGDWTAFQNT